MQAPRPVGRPAGRGATARRVGRAGGVPRLMGRMLVLLLALALAASGGMGPARAGGVGLVRAETSAAGASHAGHGAHGASHARPSNDLGTADGHGSHHEGALCSLCLLARVGVDVPRPGFPPRPLVLRAVPWTTPAIAAATEVQAPAPAARGPPVTVI